MKKFMTFTLILLIISGSFFYLGYQPQLGDIDFTGSLFGYNIQASQYTIYGLLIFIFIIISVIMRFFVGIKNIYSNILNFFTGRNKEKATDNLLNAYAYLLAKKPKTAKTFFKRAEKYYKESHHSALIRLAIESSEGAERPTSDALAKIDNQKTLKSVGSYIESLFPISQRDNPRMAYLLKESGSYLETLDVFYDFLQILISSNALNDAELAVKNARNLLSDDAFKFHNAQINLLKCYQAYEDKNPDSMLALAQESLKFYKNPIALHYVIQAYKILQRDNKAIRLIHDCFLESPCMNDVRLFLEFKNTETAEETTKRIAALPTTHKNSNPFVALQAYNFAISKDFNNLSILLNNDTYDTDNLWVTAAKICLIVEKDSLLLVEALKIFKDTLYVESKQEITNMYQHHKGNIYDTNPAIHNFIPKITKAEIVAKLSLFKEIIKAVPLLHKKQELSNIQPTENPNLYQLEGNIYTDDHE